MEDNFLKRRRELYPNDPRYHDRGYGSADWERRSRTFGLSSRAKKMLAQATAAEVVIDPIAVGPAIPLEAAPSTANNGTTIMYGVLAFDEKAA